MKKMKKILAMLLALVMVMGMTMTTMAATKDSATITVVEDDDTNTKATLTYVQVIEPDTSSLTGWKFTNDSIAKNYTDAFGLTDTNDNTAAPPTPTDIIKQAAIAMLIKNENAEAKIHKDVPKVNAATATQINQALDNVINGSTLETMANPQTVTKAGVYAIKATEVGYTYKAMAAYVGFNEVTVDGIIYSYPSLDNAKAYTKKISTTVTKVDNDPDNAVSINQEVIYTVTTAFPYFNQNDEEQNKKFKVWDKIKGASYTGLTGDDITATVTIGTETVTQQVVFEQLPENELGEYEEGFIVDLSKFIDDENSKAGKNVTVTYHAVVNAVEVENGAGSRIGGKDIESEKINLYTGKITLTKVDADANEIKLENAGFEVYKKILSDNQQETNYSPALKFKQDVQYDENGKEIVIPGQYTYDPAGTITEVFTDENGEVIIKGLDVGEYKFTEKTAPTGYSINENPLEISLEVTDGEYRMGDTTKGEDAEAKVSAGIFEDQDSIEDTKLVALPSTGGIGTTIFTVAGCGIMIAAAFFFFASRKKEN